MNGRRYGFGGLVEARCGVDEETIFAVASGTGRAGIAVIRASGPMAGSGLCRLIASNAAKRADPQVGVSARDDPHSPQDFGIAARKATVRRLTSPLNGEGLDEALVIWFPGPASFTGEDMVEFHVHGGAAVVSGVLGALAGLEGFRSAEPGEFTKRAFYNGRLDLTQAEAVADLIDAETQEQKRQALRQADGELGRLYDGWRGALISILAHLEATIDFSDEDLPAEIDAEAKRRLAGLVGEITVHLNDGRRGERLRSGVHIALLGAPNAGKSTLLNLLAGREAAIVSATAGTTRDVVEVHIDLDGCPVTIADTAGLRDSQDEIEQEGVRRASRQAELADLKVVVLDRSVWPDVPEKIGPLIDGDALVVLNKADLGPLNFTLKFQGAPITALSAKSGHGIDKFMEALTDRVKELAGLGAQPALTRARHRLALEEALSSLEAGLVEWETAGSELVAENVRLAARAIGRITGRVDVEELLDVIFSDFCIGK